jgi:carbonic anhydrase
VDRLLEGYRRFRSRVWPEERARYQQLADRGQQPHTLVIGCSDSRVDPQIVFGTAPGELFTLRNIAGLVPPYQPDTHHHGTSAALEYGVRVLKVARIVVLGHGQCGGVRAMVVGAPQEARDFVEPWMSMAQPALALLPQGLSLDEQLAYCEAEVIRVSLGNLMTFPWIAERVRAGTLELVGFHFDIHTGILSKLTPEGLVPMPADPAG